MAIVGSVKVYQCQLQNAQLAIPKYTPYPRDYINHPDMSVYTSSLCIGARVICVSCRNITATSRSVIERCTNLCKVEQAKLHVFMNFDEGFIREILPARRLQMCGKKPELPHPTAAPIWLVFS